MKEFFMQAAILLSCESKCVSKKVGCIITKNGRIISTGYNGSPEGYKNCCDIFDSNFDRKEHHKWSDENEIHAEMNAILFASKNGMSIKGATIFSTLQPCHNCLKNIVQTGIKHIIYMNEYDKYDYNESFMKYIKDKGIKYEHFRNDKLVKFLLNNTDI